MLLAGVWKFHNHSHLPRVAPKTKPALPSFPGISITATPEINYPRPPLWWLVMFACWSDWLIEGDWRGKGGLVGAPAHAISTPESSSNLLVAPIVLILQSTQFNHVKIITTALEGFFLAYSTLSWVNVRMRTIFKAHYESKVTTNIQGDPEMTSNSLVS